ncbi:hypothetical protein SAZ_27665 [Streptomyces noursei ZPM]|nr:hypothetical protein SAZ_27665 [Streptomyces noursei ZPM]
MSTTTTTSGGGLRGWARDLGMGVRFAVGGGREGWIRTLLTALGVGLGVTLLLAASTIPAIQAHRTERRLAATPTEADGPLAPSASTLVVADLRTQFRDRPLTGRMLRPDGPAAPAPPGVAALPKPGEMVLCRAVRADRRGGAGRPSGASRRRRPTPTRRWARRDIRRTGPTARRAGGEGGGAPVETPSIHLAYTPHVECVPCLWDGAASTARTPRHALFALPKAPT